MQFHIVMVLFCDYKGTHLVDTYSHLYNVVRKFMVIVMGTSNVITSCQLAESMGNLQKLSHMTVGIVGEVGTIMTLS